VDFSGEEFNRAYIPHELENVERYTLYPTILEEVLASHARLTVCLGAVVPVPLSMSAVEEGIALLANVRVALSAPEVCGLNVTVNGALWPA
jgi:hypothetical protein